MTNVAKLGGCHPEPLAHYLKALGILRLVSEQVDADARGYWESDTYYLESKLTEAELMEFFLGRYRPTPIVVPWSGGDFFGVTKIVDSSGYKHLTKTPTATSIIEAFLACNDERIKQYRETIITTLASMQSSGIAEKKDIEGAKGKQKKHEFLVRLRANLPDEVIHWMDVAIAIGEDEFIFNNLLGSGGGSDGNSHFSDNFMQCIWQVLLAFDEQKERPLESMASSGFVSREGLANSLFGSIGKLSLEKKRSPGLFNSGDVGGPNATAGFESEARSNPWDYIFTIEGSLMLAGAMTRRQRVGIPPEAAFPFSVRLSPVGYPTAVPGESYGREFWLPLWKLPATKAEISALFSEARVQTGQKFAATGVDFARAVSSIGVDRGIDRFCRIGLIRGRIGGENYYTAVGLGRWESRLRAEIRLLDDPQIEKRLDDFRRAGNDKNVPARLGRALSAVEVAIFDLCRLGGVRALQSVLIALGCAEAALAKAPKFRKDKFLSPFQFLRPAWLDQADDASSEFAIAASLASIAHPKLGAIRRNLEPVEIGKERVWWGEIDNPPGVVWNDGNLSRNLGAVLSRRCMDAQRTGINGLPINGNRPLALCHVAAYINGEVDEARIENLFWGLMLVDWRQAGRQEMERSESKDEIPSAIYALLKLCFLPDQGRRLLRRAEGPPPIPYEAEILRRLEAGDLKGAVARAARRLSASGMPPRFQIATGNVEMARRLAGSLLFPISPHDERMLAQQVVAVKSISKLTV